MLCVFARSRALIAASWRPRSAVADTGCSVFVYDETCAVEKRRRAAALRRAGLVSARDGHPGVFPQAALHGVQLAAMCTGTPDGNVFAPETRRVRRSDHHALDAFGRDLADDLRHCQRSFHRLSAGHRHGVVEQDLVGDRDLAATA